MNPPEENNPFQPPTLIEANARRPLGAFWMTLAIATVGLTALFLFAPVLVIVVMVFLLPSLLRAWVVLRRLQRRSKVGVSSDDQLKIVAKSAGVIVPWVVGAAVVWFVSFWMLQKGLDMTEVQAPRAEFELIGGWIAVAIGLIVFIMGFAGSLVENSTSQKETARDE